MSTKNISTIFIYFPLLLISIQLSGHGILGQRTLSDQDWRGPMITECPLVCECSWIITEQSVYVDCSSNSLESVPHPLPVNTVELNLDDNRITSLTSSDLTRCRQLRVLRISTNLLSEIDKDAFSSVSDLQKLYLNDNKLILNDSINVKFLNKLTNLRVLSIHHNSAFIDVVLKNLTKLRTLTIDRDEVVTFGSEFDSLINLESLSIYGRMKQLNDHTFESLGNCSLKELNIKSKNTLSELQPLTFAPLSHLETLDLGYNRGLGFESAAKAWYGLQFTNITTLVLSRIISDAEVGPTLTYIFYKDLKLSKITSLVISRNNILTIEKGLAAALPQVRHLDFSYNRLSNVGTLIYELSQMRNLKSIDFSYQSKRYLNKREVIPKKYIPQKNSLANTIKTLHKFRNKSSDMCESEAFKPCKFRSWKNISQKLDSPLPDFGPWCVLLPSNMETVNLTSSLTVQLLQFPQVVLFGYNRHLKRLVYKANGFSRVVGPFVIFYCNKSIPMTIDLSDNGAACISPDLFNITIRRGCNIGALLLSNNDLGRQLEEDVSGRVFDLYEDLVELNLAKNSIKVLPYNIFRNLQLLEKLNLSGNFLRKIEFKYVHFQKLNVMDISNNLITSLNSDVLDNFEKHFIQHNMTIDLSANPIQCACETLHFLRWLEKHQSNLIGFQRISCLYKDKLVTFDKLETVILAKLDFECSSNFALKISAGLLGLGVLTVAVSIFLHRHRWDIRYYFLNLTTKRHQYQLLRETQHTYEYDVFVSYDHRDFEWVRNELMQNTESSFSDETINLCIHGRDFTPGDTIEENILTAIKTSRKVCLVVTENFIRSKWCKFELEIARMESIDRGHNIIIPVLLTPVNMRDMPSSLQSLVRRRTYLEWEPDSSDKDEFWRRFRNAVADKGMDFWALDYGITAISPDEAGGASSGNLIRFDD